MQVLIVLNESLYDCDLQINDLQGSRHYFLSAMDDNKDNDLCINIEVFSNEFDFIITPLLPDINSTINELNKNDWKDKMAKTAMKILSSFVDKTILRVSCQYRINDIQDGDRLDITMQNYFFGTFDRFDLLGLLPMCYAFFEVSNFNHRFKLTNAYATNRKDVVKSARTISTASMLGNGLFTTLFTYPFQVGRIKRLTKNRKIRKTLIKFNNLSYTQRQRFLEKQEKFLDR